MIEVFSTRHAEIEAAVAARGAHGAHGAMGNQRLPYGRSDHLKRFAAALLAILRAIGTFRTAQQLPLLALRG